ncbi:hypothetical protein AXG93_461s1160 [Marchantia polymorpha subsp. ruderalis]|uniref:Choline transporter-like protein n=1 Tax=Marchantia polymorpha subsp. ruderalis TaxID=1480154 RepID=A0A176VGE4_MARPO|nr:hypothetical protein AXG93_461s1160 [Marchantia polymorpha subsp. ruderalis]
MGRKGSSPGPTGAIIGGMEMSDRGSPLPMGEMTVQKPRIKTERHCRDIPFLILFGLFWLGMVANSGFGWNQGNPRRLLYGLDYKGQLCEGDFDVKYWMNPNQVYDSGVVDNPFNIKDARAICLKSCPSTSANGTLGWVCDYPEGPITLTKTEWADRTYDYFDTLSAELKNTSLNLLGPCYPVLFNSSNFFWSCQLTASPSNESLAQWTSLGGVSVNQGEFIVKAIQDLLSAPGEIFKRYIADLENAWPVLVVCGGIAPLLLSIVWLVVIRLFAGVVTWITIIVLNFATIAVTVYLYIKAGWIGTDAISAVIGSDAVDTLALETSHSMQNHLKIVAVVMTIISVIIVLITVVLIKRVFMAVAVLKVASKAIGAIPSLMIYPVFPALVLLFFFVYWMLLPTFPVLSSTKRLLRYSLGSVAIGSFLVAVIQMIRFILEFIRNKLKAVEAAPGGCLISILCCCAQCCLGCIEWTLKFINRNAYIVIAIKGKGFFRAAAKASGLIINNILRVGTVNVLGDFVLFLGKACVSVAGAFFAFLMLDQHRYKSGSNKVSSPLFPVLFCWIFGYSIASMFFGVVEMAIDTILLSFCIDCEENNGNARFAPPLLMDTLGRHARYEEERKSARRG